MTNIFKMNQFITKESLEELAVSKPQHEVKIRFRITDDGYKNGYKEHSVDTIASIAAAIIDIYESTSMYYCRDVLLIK